MTGILVGAVASGLRTSGAAASFAALEAQVGHQNLRGCYAGQTYTNFMSSALGAVDNVGGVSLRTTHIRWDPDCEALVSENPSGFNPAGLLAYLAAGRTGTGLAGYGTETAANIAWLLSAPVNSRVIWTPWHEADINVGNTGGGYDWASVAHFKLGLQVLCDMVHAMAGAQGSNWLTALCLTASAWKGISTSAQDPDNFWPGAGYVDVMAVDAYNEGSLDASRWDSVQVSIGYPADSNEATAYQSHYGGTNGYRTSGVGGSWSNGFLGWCEARGVTKWMLGEFGTIRNVDGLSPTWVGGGAGSKQQWITTAVAFVEGYNADVTKGAKCIGLEYFYRGRKYTGSDYLTTTVHLLADGSPQSCVGAYTFSPDTRPTSGNVTGHKIFTTDNGHVYQWSGSAWTDLGTAAVESWELWWNEDGSGWDGTGSSGSSNATWAGVTSSLAATIRITQVTLATTNRTSIVRTKSTSGRGAEIRIADLTLSTVSSAPQIRIADLTLSTGAGAGSSAQLRIADLSMATIESEDSWDGTGWSTVPTQSGISRVATKSTSASFAKRSSVQGQSKVTTKSTSGAGGGAGGATLAGTLAITVSPTVTFTGIANPGVNDGAGALNIALSLNVSFVGNAHDGAPGAGSITIVPDLVNLPPRMLVTVKGFLGATITITRNDPTGANPVRLANPATLDGGDWVGYDYEAPFGETVTYTATPTAGPGPVTSDPVVLAVTQAWLIHPGFPSLSQPIQGVSLGTETIGSNTVVLAPLGRQTAIAIGDGTRQAPAGTLGLKTVTAEDKANLDALLADDSTLLLQIAYDYTAETEYMWVSLGNLTRDRRVPTDLGNPAKLWSAPYQIVEAPSGLLQSQRTWADVLAEFATWQDILDTYATWADLLTDTRIGS